MSKILIDILGTGLDIFVVLIFFETIWVVKKNRWQIMVSGILVFAISNTASTSLLAGTNYLPIVSLILIFISSFYFESKLATKIMFSLAITAISFGLEMLVLELTKWIVRIPSDQIQSIPVIFLSGVLVSKLLSLLVVCIIRIFVKNNKQEDMQFNILMGAMPIQSIIICFIVYGYSVNIDAFRTSALGIAAVIISLFLVFIFMIIINNQRKAFMYKKEHKLAQMRLELQIEHYQQLYKEQHKIKLIQHDIGNKTDAIYGLLAAGCVQDAMNHISEMRSAVKGTKDVVNTGLPPVDAVLTAKISKADEYGISITYKVLIDDQLFIDQFDLAIIIANALDNAIEGILRSSNVDTNVVLHISSTNGYIKVIVENSASVPIDEHFQTSKPDQSNHGFGISQMRSVAEKYTGDIQPNFNSNTGRFTLNVLLKNDPN
jgi:uncharacterized protein YoxC